MTILSFEKPSSDPTSENDLRQSLQVQGIVWRALKYHKWPPVVSTIADVAQGIVVARRLVTAADLVHARSHVPAMIAYCLWRMSRVPFVFDHRGRMADEYADAGIWPQDGWLYQTTDAWERRFIRQAAWTVVLTKRLRGELAEPRVTVIPCAIDLATFRPAPAGVRPFDLVYAGSWSGLYLVEETLRFHQAYRKLRPDARLLIVTSNASGIGSLPAGVEARSASPSEIPSLLRMANAGVSLRRSGRAQVAASPVKVSEYFACGLPVVTSAGVGDLDELMIRRRVGVVVANTTADGLQGAAAHLLELQRDGEELSQRCRQVAEDIYGLDDAVDAYDGLYREIARRREAELLGTQARVE